MKTESQKPAEKEIKGIITDLKNKLESLSPAGKFFLIEIIKEIDKARSDEGKKVAEEIEKKLNTDYLNKWADFYEGKFNVKKRFAENNKITEFGLGYKEAIRDVVRKWEEIKRKVGVEK